MNFGKVVGGTQKKSAAASATPSAEKPAEKPVEQKPKEPAKQPDKGRQNMPKSELEKWLDGVEDTATAALEEAKESAPKDFNDGTYVGLVTQHEFKMSKKDKPGVLTRIMFLESLAEPEYVGESTGDWQDLEREDAFKYYRWRLSAMGIAEGLEARDILDEMRKNPTDLFGVVENRLVVKFQLSTDKVKEGPNKGKEFQNLKIIKVMENYDLSDAPEPKKHRKKDKGGDEEVGDGNDGVGDDIEAKPGMSVKFKTTIVEMRRGKEVTDEVEGIGVLKMIDNENGRCSVMYEGEEIEMPQTDVVELLDEKPV
jgi:hypothetical protein